jgi:NADH-quinone oxidoreductase subunit E
MHPTSTLHRCDLDVFGLVPFDRLWHRRGMTLSAATVTAIHAEVARYPSKKTALLPALKLAQKDRGWLSKETLGEVADLVGLPHSHAVELATFYAMLFTEPVAPVRVEFCIQLPCALAGAEAALDKAAKLLDVEMQGTHGTRHGHTKDHQIELHGTVECYGACHRAPMCRVGDDYVENLKTDDDLKKLVGDLKIRAQQAPGH